MTRRVVSLVLLIELLFAVSTTTLAFFYERHEYFEALDIALRGHADSLMGAVVEAADDSDSVLLDVAGLQTPRDHLYEVWEKDTLLGRTGDLSGGNPALRQGGDAFLKLKVGGKRYRAIRIHGMRVIDPATLKVRHNLVVLYAAPTAGVWRAVGRAARFFAIANAVLLLLTGLLVFVFVRRSITPLYQLAAEASTIAANSWRFAPSDEARSVEELEPLVTALEGVILRLERSFGQQRTFVSDAAHELKTSVAVVKSSIQLLSMKERTSAEYQAGLERCQMDCVRMEELVQRMLTLAMVEEGDPKQRIVEDVAVMSVVHEVMDDLATTAQLRGVRLECSGDDAVRAAITKDRWKTVCTELLQNAIQHSPQGEVVSVEAAVEGDRVTVVVRNAGEPIAVEMLPHLFDRFYRGDPSRARSTGGTGLGLAICKAMVEQAGGRISVRHGAGVEVRVDLPECVG
ncbi:MAG: Heavy metal sensor histidine kinase [Edaphobacter sp.]|nr:Heavy metal sensor histidine kinase [Edaphobacter sp.]